MARAPKFSDGASFVAGCTFPFPAFVIECPGDRGNTAQVSTLSIRSRTLDPTCTRVGASKRARVNTPSHDGPNEVCDCSTPFVGDPPLVLRRTAVCELVALPPAIEQMENAGDGGLGQCGVARRSIHQALERGIVSGYEGRDPAHIEVIDGVGVLGLELGTCS